jgi:hypothetical protein
MTPAEREQLIKAKAEKLARKGVQVKPQEEATQEVFADNEALPEEPAIKPRRRKNK